MAKDDAQPVTQQQLADLIAALPAAFAALAAQQPTSTGGVTAEQLQGILSHVTRETQRAMKPENAMHADISVYSYPWGSQYLGDQSDEMARKHGESAWKPKPTLMRESFFCGNPEAEERLTPLEIELYNAIKEPRECRGGAWRAEIQRPRSVGGKEKLFVWVPAASVDHRMMLPGSLSLILTELAGGPSTENVMDLLRQIQEKDAQLQAMRGLMASKGVTATELEKALLAS